MRNRNLIKELFAFIHWNALGSMAIVVRNQGVAITLNLFFGTIVNAAYAIANQVNALVLAFASTLTTVFTPTITRSMGEGNKTKMVNTAIFSSKSSFLLSSIMALPLLTFTPEILTVWLNDVPDYTVSFCRLIILSFVIQQIYPGLNRAIYAVGHIRNYQIGLAVLSILVIPVGLLLFKAGKHPNAILYAMLMAQVLSLVLTYYSATRRMDLSGTKYLSTGVVLPLVLFGLFCGILWGIKHISPFLSIILAVCAIGFYCLSFFYIVYSRNERQQLWSVITPYLGIKKS